ncbi:MAG: molecular chaperone [bacterium]
MEAPLTRERMAEVASSRSNLYGLLSLIFRQEPTLELLRQIRQPEVLKALSAMGLSLEKTFLGGNEEQVLEELVLEYTRLFLGPGPHISPHESVHRADESRPGLMWGDSTVEVKKLVEWLGLSYGEEYRGMPDHISVELELMQKITEREKEAWEQQDRDTVARCLEYEKKFIDEHLLRWIPTFCDRVMEGSQLDFYREMARVTKEYLRFEKEQVHKLSEETGNFL